MYTWKTKTYIIDLALDEEERWSEVIRAEKRTARRIAKEATDKLGWFQRVLLKSTGGIFMRAYRALGGRYTGEIECWANALGVTVGEAALMNCIYELSHVRLLGCTAGIRWVPGLGMVHLRSMDWPLETIGDGTRIFRFKRGKREFISVGIVGFVGVLSGMLPGAYSVTINWAPSFDRPHFDFGPAFLLRTVLEDCDTYEEAVYSLKKTKIAAPVFYAVCGTNRGEACVIERTRTQATVRAFKPPTLVQANHHVARRFKTHNEEMDYRYDEDIDETVLEDSERRAATMDRELNKIGGAKTLSQAAKPLRVPPVRNDESVQQMVFLPKTGELKVWRLVE